MNTYNGWKNYETWNVNLWLNNDEGLYDLARRCGRSLNYRKFATQFLTEFSSQTPDGVSWLDDSLDYEALNESLEEIGNS